MPAQLHDLYHERARLFAALGTADADEIVAMVRSLEAQLVDLYGERRRSFVAREGAERSKLTSDAEARDDR